MTEQEEEIKRDLEKSFKISLRIAENVSNSIQKRMRKGDNVQRLTSMILHTTTSMLLGCFVNLYMQQKEVDKEMLEDALLKIIVDAMKMHEASAIKAQVNRKH